MKWISIDERLPDCTGQVLTYSEEIDGSHFRLITPNLKIKTFPASVTHWMPLPAPPEKN